MIIALFLLFHSYIPRLSLPQLDGQRQWVIINLVFTLINVTGIRSIAPAKMKVHLVICDKKY